MSGEDDKKNWFNLLPKILHNMVGLKFLKLSQKQPCYMLWTDAFVYWEQQLNLILNFQCMWYVYKLMIHVCNLNNDIIVCFIFLLLGTNV